MIFGMRLLHKLGCCGSFASKSNESEPAGEINDAGEAAETVESHLLRTVGWISAALGAVAIGLLVGREIRERYKFNRRTPYDLYSHSGDELPDADCGVGI
jgi:hypothetical protein